MSKPEVIAAIDDAWRSFKAAFEPLTGNQMGAPRAIGEWSLKDLIGHISSRETVLIRLLLSRNDSDARGDAAYDEFDSREVARKGRYSLARLVTEMDETHRALRQVLRDTPEEQFEHGTAIREQIDRETALHYHEHAIQIRNWSAGRSAKRRPGDDAGRRRPRHTGEKHVY